MTLDSLPGIDLGIFIILSFFVIIGLMRGFTNDFFSFFTWFGAIAIGKLVSPIVKPLISSYITTPLFADIVSLLIPFLFSLMLLVTTVQTISRFVRNSVLKGLDRSLGIVSGFMRGTIIICSLYVGLLMFYKPGEKPHWLTEAKFESYLDFSTKFLINVIFPPNLLPPRIYHHLYNSQFQTVDKSPEEYAESLSFPKPSSRSSQSNQRSDSSSNQQPRYTKKQQQTLSQLFKSHAS